jgi:molybdopterin converting factor small subunit
MKIFFEYLGLLHIEGIKNKSYLKVDNNCSITDLFTKLKIRKEHQKFISVFINDEEKPRHTVLKENDRVKLFLPTGGG